MVRDTITLASLIDTIAPGNKYSFLMRTMVHREDIFLHLINYRFS